MLDNQLSIARRAHYQTAATRKPGTMQYRFLGLLVTICAYVMRRFAAAHRFFEGVSEHAATDVSQLVSLFLCFPCFEANQFFFQITYALQQRRAFLISEQNL